VQEWGCPSPPTIRLLRRRRIRRLCQQASGLFSRKSSRLGPDIVLGGPAVQIVASPGCRLSRHKAHGAMPLELHAGRPEGTWDDLGPRSARNGRQDSHGSRCGRHRCNAGYLHRDPPSHKIQVFPPASATDPRKMRGLPPASTTDPPKMRGLPPASATNPRKIQGFPPASATDPRKMRGFPPASATDPRKMRGFPPASAAKPHKFRGLPPASTAKPC
jgi:hypothetical protein